MRKKIGDQCKKDCERKKFSQRTKLAAISIEINEKQKQKRRKSS